MQKKEHKPVNGLVLALIIIIGLFIGYIYYSQTDNSFALPVPEGVDDSRLIKFKDLKFDFSFLENENFAKLKIYGDTPVLPGSTGRPDIFAPF